MNILGVRIDNFTKKEILAKIESFLNEEKFHQVATVNPEFVLRAQKDEDFKNVLNSCDLNVADGVGIWYAFIRNFGFLRSRIAGVELLENILKIANEKELSIYLAINGNGLSKFSEIKKVLEKKYPNISIAGKNFYNLNESCKIQDTRYQILISNFGSPHQEKFLNLQKNGNIRLAMGVGGSFDFMTGKVSRAPKILRFLGLEWLWRLVGHPSTDRKFMLRRLKRIFDSTIIFPIRIFLNK